MRRLSASTPMIANVKPSGEMFLHDLESDGGIPALMGRLRGVMELDTYAGDGRRWTEASNDPEPVTGCLVTMSRPVTTSASLTILAGTLAPMGAVLKRSAATPRLCRHRGRAVVFDGVEQLRARIDDPAIDIDCDSVLVLRGVGPRGGPGMPEVGHLPIPTRLLAQGISDMVRISDARMSGTATGTVVLHVVPEAAVGGPLALVHDGDFVELDADAGRLDLLVDPDEMQRRQRLLPRLAIFGRGFELLYHRHVTQADTGCDFDFLQGGRHAV
jgi:dihydroxy-acid dehydratase